MNRKVARPVIKIPAYNGTRRFAMRVHLFSIDVVNEAAMYESVTCPHSDIICQVTMLK
jgi:hypothetical protein